MAERASLQFLLSFFFLLLQLHPCLPSAITPETCSSSSSSTCQSLVNYISASNLRLSDLTSFLFPVSLTTLLASNDFNLSSPDLPSIVIPGNKPLQIPLTCGCVNNIRTITSVVYTVRSGDTLSIISDTYYSHLISYQEIAIANSIPNVNVILPNANYTIPIPCACRNGSDNGHPAEFLSYGIQTGDDLSGIASRYNTTAAQLQQINNVTSAALPAGSILFVPLQVCTTTNFSNMAVDANLIVPEGSSVITANNCVQCSCNNGTLHCSPTPPSIGKSCGSMTCNNSKLKLGSYNTSSGARGCIVDSCVYKGYTNTGTILSSVDTITDPTCPAPPPPPSLYNAPSGLGAAPLTAPTTPTSPSPAGSQNTPPPPAGTSPSVASPLAFIPSWWYLSLVFGFWLPFVFHDRAF